MMTPDQRLADAFVALASSTADDSAGVPGPLSVLAHRAPVLLGTCAAAVVFAPKGYDAVHVAGSNPQVSRLEREAVGWQEGPGHDCHQAGAGTWTEMALDSRPTRQRWPHYTPQALRLGYTHVAALPLRENSETIGAFVLLSDARHALPPAALVLGRSLADFTAVLLERAREADRSRTLTAQLEQALTSRVVIEQAKGVLSTLRGVSLDEAFGLLRKHARSGQRPLKDVAREVVEGHADPELTDPAVVRHG
ncbi:GAF and ANTAR domain-containing protein [Streptomyces acidiscabies]|uniref:GAF and ANTAR domain-containing protein n=1 Tax=Streptomyces acidiscabies TaxID=42234 RepID=A0AAP6ELC8_9ACTN|nr:GAF and ANTAR domain-containing protein [Streptomyces acidiscabies]MDX2966918.1 GAF and ANTAR domain-containing protein [Streptomyces acidiscabies]MDX3026016.1 GAF and ANTAR domain-containing protein [Streptomyces acidiscabies]MDX3797022.1 GAF and ANTAR domain-containing protein [Streptomyces acidiscabies]GAV45760.1 ANTAR domain protein [Streptomyces acidiscabies]